MNKNARIKELEASLAREAALVTDLINGFAKTEAATKERHAEQIDAEREAHESAFEADALKHIRNGFIPVAELRALVSGHGVGIVIPGEEMANVDLEWPLKPTPVQKAILDALTAPEKPKYAAGGTIFPPIDFGSSYGAASTLSPKVAHYESIAAAYRKLLNSQEATEPVSIKWTNEPPFYKVGDRVNVQTLPNNGGFLVNGPIV